MNSNIKEDPIWDQIQNEGRIQMEQEPILASFLHRVILRHPSFEQALAYLLAGKLEDQTLDATTLMEVITECFSEDPGIALKSRKDIEAVASRDPACDYFAQPLLFFKGYHALQSQRISHQLWHTGRKMLALYLQSRISEVFAVDIHPAAKIGEGILLDHATGIVIGETAEIGDDCMMYHGVTLGGTIWDKIKRHPTLKDGVVIGAGAKILGPITLGNNVRVGSNSVVVKSIDDNCTVVGIPGRVLEQKVDDSDKFDFYAVSTSGDESDPTVKAVKSIIEHLADIDKQLDKVSNAFCVSEEQEKIDSAVDGENK